MKAVIDGIRYDTEKAINVTWVSCNCGSPDWFRGTIYVTPRSRRWFLAGEGGPYSMFGRRVGFGGWARGAGIAPLSHDRARELIGLCNGEC